MSQSLLVSAAAPRRSQLVAASVTALLLLVLTVITGPWRMKFLGDVPGFVLSFGVLTLFADVITAAVLFSQAHAARDRSLADLGAAYAFSAAMMVPYTLTFPQAFGSNVVIGTWPIALWYWLVWHVGFAVGVSRYAWRHGRSATTAAPNLRLTLLGAVLPAIVLSVVLWVTLPYLPQIIGGVYFTSLFALCVGPTLLAINAVTLGLVLVRLRGRTTISIWLAVAVIAAALESGLTIAGRRFTVSWYLAKCLSLATNSIVLAALLTELSSVFRKIYSLNGELFHTAFHDSLTKLPNRTLFTDRLNTALARARLDPASCYAVMFIDLDRFKLVNDSLGHRAGDLLLMEVANRLSGCIRKHDTLARIGGDEFAMLIEGFDDEAFPVAIAERVADAMQLPMWIGKQEIFSTNSLGVVCGSPRYQTPDELLRDADIAMYEAKRSGSGKYAIFVDSMRDISTAALKLQTDLKNALSRNEFFLNYQPICNAASGLITGVEALIRWQHPERGLVPPNAFIPAAEETGLIRDIGRWLLQETCTQMQRWQTSFPDLGLRLSVNTSAIELKDPNFTRALHDVLTETGLAPRSLQIEVTEAIFVDDAPSVGAILAGIRALGVRIALDDFGTGYSSLSYLDRFPMDTLKVDQSFVSRMLTQRRTAAIVETVVALGHALTLEIVAEGVETAPQLHALREAGCTSVQGYFLGRPMRARELEAALQRQRPFVAKTSAAALRLVAYD